MKIRIAILFILIPAFLASFIHFYKVNSKFKAISFELQSEIYHHENLLDLSRSIFESHKKYRNEKFETVFNEIPKTPVSEIEFQSLIDKNNLLISKLAMSGRTWPPWFYDYTIYKDKVSNNVLLGVPLYIPGNSRTRGTFLKINDEISSTLNSCDHIMKKTDSLEIELNIVRLNTLEGKIDTQKVLRNLGILKM